MQVGLFKSHFWQNRDAEPRTTPQTDTLCVTSSQLHLIHALSAEYGDYKLYVVLVTNWKCLKKDPKIAKWIFEALAHIDLKSQKLNRIWRSECFTPEYVQLEDRKWFVIGMQKIRATDNGIGWPRIRELTLVTGK